MKPSQPQQSTLTLSLVAMSLVTILIQLQASVQGNVRDLVPILIAGLLTVAGVIPPERPEL
jgi:hypothetical protein